MTNKTTLVINRVVIAQSGNIAYDEKFHTGLNVIRGENGVGKSSIIELISYGLGADIKKTKWKKEALLCSEVIIELKINKLPYVFKRKIEGDSQKPPIQIFEGSYTDSKNINKAWTKYGYRKTDSKKSFAMQIFSLLGYEQYSTDEDQSLTMHQIMRLLYVDQDTPSSKIFRLEPFIYDRESLRKAIGDFMFGLDNLEAHKTRQELIAVTKIFEKLNEETLTIFKVLGKSNLKSTTASIESEIATLYESLVKTNQSQLDLKRDSIHADTEKLTKRAVEINKKISLSTGDISRMEERLFSIGYDISNSQEFITTIEHRESSLRNSQLTVNELGMIDFEYCPSCLTKVSLPKSISSCKLCKSEFDEKIINESYVQALNELDFQKKESSKILNKYIDEKSELSVMLKNEYNEINRFKNEFNEINSFTSEFEAKLTMLARDKGFIESQILALKDRLSLAAEIQILLDKKDAAAKLMSSLTTALKSLEFLSENRRKSISLKVSQQVISILSDDLGYEKSFSSPDKFEYDFSTDSMLLDDVANFSASSNTLLKNTFHLSVLLSAINDDKFRIPCFMMFDNIEDNGMTEERSHNFQKILFNLCKEISSDYQLIMTTSMVDPLLNVSKIGVGPFYNKGEHTLNIH
jgi:DNA repair exonuclease SbcCD ATPase subunit